MELFIPEQFIEKRKQLQLKGENKRQVSIEPGTEMEELLRRMYQVDPSMVKAAALSLSDRQADMLAGYLPYNFYGEDETRLFEVMDNRLDERSSRTLYMQWQNAYSNPACNEFMIRMSRKEGGFKKMLEGYGISTDAFIKVLESINIPLGFDEELMGKHFSDDQDLDNRLRGYGIIEESMLDIACKCAMLTYCGRIDYLNCSQENLIAIFQDYDLYMQKKFLMNFLRRMSLKDLESYPELAAHLRSITGYPGSVEYLEFFDEADPEIVLKYADWINIFKLNIFLENDERLDFWKRYRYVNVIRYPVSNTLVLEFKNHVAVEFLGDDKAPVYFCEKEIFRNMFYAQLTSMDNSDIRIYFKTHKDECMDSRNHSFRWQNHVDSLISKKNITMRIGI